MGRHWTLDASLDANPDMRLFLDIIDQLAAIYHVDVTRVFATGHSSGGFCANFLNCTSGRPSCARSRRTRAAVRTATRGTTT